MKFLISLLLMPLSLFATTKIAIIGDSISVGHSATNNLGYVYMLQKRYMDEQKDVVILNRSYNGARTNTGSDIVVNLITTDKIDYMVINLGINDVLANISSPEITHNLDTMIWKAKGMQAQVILGKISCARVNPSYQSTLQEAYDYVINKRNIHSYEFLTNEIVFNHSPDTVHPDDIGHQMIADELYKQLEILGVK